MSAGAANLTKEEYKVGKADISAQLKAAKAACDAFKSNAKDICMQEAKGRDKVALAELETRYEPSTKHNYQFATAKADAAYSVAKEKCDDQAGNAKDVCRKEAKSVHVAAVADAKLSEKTTLNNAEATEKINTAKTVAAGSNASAQATATSTINKADYKAAAEKCDALAGDVKTKCVDDAKAKFGQN
jgi:hypothetical protein